MEKEFVKTLTRTCSTSEYRIPVSHGFLKRPGSHDSRPSPLFQKHSDELLEHLKGFAGETTRVPCVDPAGSITQAGTMSNKTNGLGVSSSPVSSHAIPSGVARVLLDGHNNSTQVDHPSRYRKESSPEQLSEDQRLVEVPQGKPVPGHWGQGCTHTP